jgi:hypothetical protein
MDRAEPTPSDLNNVSSCYRIFPLICILCCTYAESIFLLSLCLSLCEQHLTETMFFFGCLLFALVRFSSGCFRFFFCFFRLLVNGKFDRCGGGFISVRHTSRRSLERSRQIFGRRVVRTTDESNNNCTSPSVSVVVSFVVGSVE